MNESDSSPQIGQIVRILQGREAGQYAVVIDVLDERFVLIADGDKRKFDRPKKKNIAHLELMDYVSPEVQNSLIEIRSSHKWQAYGLPYLNLLMKQ